MGLKVNRAETRIVDLKKDGERVDFLGYSFRFDRDLKGCGHRYLNVYPSKKSLVREREKLRQMTSRRMCFKPIPALIRELNRHLNGWSNFFDLGCPRMAKRHINAYSRIRLTKHLKRRSQRPYHPPEGVSIYRHLFDLGLVYP